MCYTHSYDFPTYNLLVGTVCTYIYILACVSVYKHLWLELIFDLFTVSMSSSSTSSTSRSSSGTIHNTCTHIQSQQKIFKNVLTSRPDLQHLIPRHTTQLVCFRSRHIIEYTYTAHITALGKEMYLVMAWANGEAFN